MSLPEAKLLNDPPNDGVTDLSYIPSSPELLASTSWDGSVRIHDTTSFACTLSQTMDSGPLFSVTCPDGDVLTGGMDGSIRKLDVQKSAYSVVGTHSGEPAKLAVSCLSHLNDSNLIVSAGWNATCHVWDVRQSAGQPVAKCDLPGKAFGLDVDRKSNRIVVATSDRRIVFCEWKAGTLSVAVDRESSLKYQSRCVSFFPDGNGIAIGSIEGRVAIENLEEFGLSAGKKYSFKCHRVNDSVYPVNAIAFHPKYGTFCTGGCDGTVVSWDGLHKKKLATFPKFPTSIAALAFNHDGSQLAIASSYTFEEGDRDHPRDEIYVRPMLDSECQPKTK